MNYESENIYMRNIQNIYLITPIQANPFHSKFSSGKTVSAIFLLVLDATAFIISLLPSLHLFHKHLKGFKLNPSRAFNACKEVYVPE